MGSQVLAVQVTTLDGKSTSQIFHESPISIGSSARDVCQIMALPPGAVNVEFDDEGVWLASVHPQTHVEVNGRPPPHDRSQPLKPSTEIVIAGHGTIVLKHQSFAAAMADRFGPSSPVPQIRSDESLLAASTSVGAIAVPSKPLRMPRTALLDAPTELPRTSLLEAAVPADTTVEDLAPDLPSSIAPQPAPAALSVSVGAILSGRYELIAKLGAGGMGAVFEARDKRFSEAPSVAVKVLNATFSNNFEAHARFKREADISSRLRQNDNIIKIFDYGVDRGVPYIVMELLKGQDFSTRWLHGTLSRADSLEVLLQVCAGVFAAHEKGIIHRDLKPQNVFITEGRLGLRVKILDFGISVGTTLPTLTAPGMVVGTWEYLAAEIARGEPATEASDQYAIGVMLYQALTGQLPFGARDPVRLFQSIAEGRFPKPRDLAPDLAPDLESIILRSMSLDPAQRYASVQALGAALLPHVSPDAQRSWMQYFTTTNPNALYSSPSPRVAAPALKETRLLEEPRVPKVVGKAPEKKRRDEDRKDSRLLLLMVTVTLAIVTAMFIVKMLLG